VPDPYAWPLDPFVVVVPLLVAAYTSRVARRGVPPWRAACFAAGNLLLLAVFATPVETIALHYLLTAHLLQNVVAAEWAPALLVLGLPPSLAAEAVGRWRLLRAATIPFVALPLWLATYAAWHVPAVYDLALRHPHSLLHLEHVTYLTSGCLMWWPIVHGRRSTGARAGYAFAAFVLASPLGLLISLLERPVYDFYVQAPGLWGLSDLTDQEIAGVTMAAEQAVVFFAVLAYLFARFFAEQETAADDELNAVRGRTRPAP
jgi:cytochrome c oxidase assembly factor CtaG